MISLKNHHIGDYLLSIFLIVAPGIFDMPEIPMLRLSFYGCALLIFLSTLRFSVPCHMKIDILVGLWLIMSPLLLSYKIFLTSTQYDVHVFLGFLIILFVGETQYRRESSIAGTKVSLDLGHFSKSG